MKKIVIALVAAMLLGTSFGAYAQDKITAEEAPKKKSPIEGTLGVDLVTNYLWRGQQNGGVSLQPTAGLGWKGLYLGLWGSFAIAPNERWEGTQEELDVVLSYTYKGFHVGVTDYYCFENGHPFFKYGGENDSAHTFEANIGYDFGFLSVNWYTNFAGNVGTNDEGKRMYSSYLELSAPFHLAHLDWTATLGVVPYHTHFYSSDDSHGFHINQVALKAEYPFTVRNFNMAAYAQAMVNPSSRNFYFAAGFSFNVF